MKLLLLSMLRSLYDPNASFSQNVQAYDLVLKDIEIFSLHSQVYHLLNVTGCKYDIPASFYRQLKDKYTKCMYQNLLLKHKEQELLEYLESKCIPVMPLKGIRFAETYYGHFAARVTSDMDLFVRSDRLHEAIASLESCGYVFEIIKDHHARMHKHGLMVELHWTLDKQHWSELNTSPFWIGARTLENFRYVKELSPLHTFYFMCLHGARHQMDSVRYLMDIVQILHSNAQPIDYQQLMKQTESDKTTKRVQAVLSIVYQQFPHLHAVKPLPFKVMETHWDYHIIRSAKLGKKTTQYYIYKLFFRHFIFDTWKHRMKSIRNAY